MSQLCHAFHCKLVLRVEKPVQMQKVAWDQGEALVFQRLQMSKVYAALCSERRTDLFSYLKLAWWCLWSSGGKVPLLAKLICFLSDLQWMRCKATSYHQQLWLKKKKKFIKLNHCIAEQHSSQKWTSFFIRKKWRDAEQLSRQLKWKSKVSRFPVEGEQV